MSLSGEKRKTFARIELLAFEARADQRRPGRQYRLGIAFGWIGATTAFDYRSIDPIGVKVPACVISAALWTYSSNLSYLPYCRRIPTFMLAACLKGTVSRLMPCFF